MDNISKILCFQTHGQYRFISTSFFEPTWNNIFEAQGQNSLHF